MKFLQLFLLLLVPSFFFAQGPIYDKVQQAKSRTVPAEFNLVKVVNSDLRSSTIPKKELTKGVIVELDHAQIMNLHNTNAGLIKMRFPLGDQSTVTVDLVENEVFADDFIFRKSSSEKEISRYAFGKYYHGVINNDPTSLVSISVFKNEVIGLISNSRGNYVIGKLKGDADNKHIIYNDIDLVNPMDFECGTEDDGRVYTQEELTYAEGSRDAGDCIRVYIEIDDVIVTDKGGAIPATNYITGLFNEVITLYANDGVSMNISEIKAWDTPAPYSGGSTSAILASYQANTGTFNGDLSHLVSYPANGGIAAGFNALCNLNPDYSKCYSGIQSTYNTVPTYSWSVMVCTHEMGHLIGSRHTHACVWNGNGTAIDRCSGFVEGTCPNPVPLIPPAGGTIMSYCHQQAVGINLSLGFGPQPAAVLLNNITEATCLYACGHNGPTCTDGIMNGTETGVDCGGPDCAPCAGDICMTNEITLFIQLDAFPSETRWKFRNANNQVVATGGNYFGVSGGSTVSQKICLDYGCYSFTIYDEYGDGICCAYGNGSYTVKDQNLNVLASGGAFGSIQTTNFCLNAPCDDGIQNGNEEGIDCGGSFCEPCPTCFDGIQNGDETGIDCGGMVCAPCVSCDEYVIISEENMEIEGTTIHSGGIGVLNEDEEAKIDDGSLVIATGTFVKAPEVSVTDGSQVNVIIEEQADPCMPEFLYNSNPSNNDVNVGANQTVTLNQAIYDDIEVGEGATVIFSGHQNVYIDDFDAGKKVKIIFNQCTNLRVEKEFRLGSETDFNTANENVAVFSEDKIAFEGRNIAKGLFYTLEEIIIYKGKSSDRNKFYGQYIGRELDAEKYTDFYYQAYVPCNIPAPFIAPEDGNIEAMKEVLKPGVQSNLLNSGSSINVSELSVAPNPFNTETNISFKLDQEDYVIIEIYNLNGQLVNQLISGIMPSGAHQLNWKGDTREGNLLGNGIYLVMLKTNDQVITKKVSLVK